MSLRILLADDHELVRAGLRSILERQAGMEVVAEAETGREAVRLTKELSPDIVLMDVSMPELNGVEATRQILNADPNAKVIALSMYSDRQFVAEVLKAGALGYLLKNSALAELVMAIQAVAKRSVYLSPKIAGVVVEDYVRHSPGSQAVGGAFGTLTPREREVLQLLAEGKTSKEIAAHLNITAKTVETHRGQIMDKLNLRSVAELTKYAIRHGLTPLEP
jgi:two-component system response regulator NreC